MTVRITTPAYTRGVSSWLLPRNIRRPSPSSAPASSPKTAPITATDAPIRRPLKKPGQRGGQLDAQQPEAAAGAEAAHQLQQVGVDRAQPVQQADGDREERDQRDERELRPDAVVEGEHEDRREHEDRDRLRGHQQRVGARRAAAGPGASRSRARPRRRSRSRARAAPRRSVTHALSSRRSRSSRSACQVSDGDASRRSSTESQLATHCQAPSASSRSDGRRERAPQHPSASSARSFSVDELRVGHGLAARARARERHLDLGDDAARARRHHDHAVGQVERLLDVVGHEQRRARLRLERLGEPRLHLRAGERVERGEGLVEQQQRPAGEERAQEGDALAHAAGELVGGRALEARQAEALEERRRAAARLAAAARRPPRARAAAFASASRQGSSRSFWGMYDGGGASTVARVRLLEARRPARAASTCRSPTARRCPTISPRADAEVDSAPAPRPCPKRRRRRAAARRRSPSREWSATRSLRGHYPTGSKGQHRGPGCYLSPPPRAPLFPEGSVPAPLARGSRVCSTGFGSRDRGRWQSITDYPACLW